MALRPAHATCLGLALLWARPVHAQAPIPAPAPPAATLAAAPVVVERREALDVNRSRCGFEIRTRFGQKIEGVFPRFEGELLRLADGRHQVRLRMDARQVEIPDKPRYTAWMRGEDFFDVEHHPLVQFDSEPYAGDITVRGGSIVGQLSIRGISHTETLTVMPAECPRAGYDCDVISRGTVLRGRYGMDSWQVALGDRVTFILRARLAEAPAP